MLLHLTSSVLLRDGSLQAAVNEARFASVAAWVAVGASAALIIGAALIASGQLRRAKRLQALDLARDYVAALRLWSELRTAVESLIGKLDGEAEVLAAEMSTFLETTRAIRVSATNLLGASSDPSAILKAERASQALATTEEVLSRVLAAAGARPYSLKQYALATAKFVVDNYGLDLQADKPVSWPIGGADGEPRVTPKAPKVGEASWMRAFTRIVPIGGLTLGTRRSSTPRAVRQVKQQRFRSVRAELA